MFTRCRPHTSSVTPCSHQEHTRPGDITLRHVHAEEEGMPPCQVTVGIGCAYAFCACILSAARLPPAQTNRAARQRSRGDQPRARTSNSQWNRPGWARPGPEERRRRPSCPRPAPQASQASPYFRLCKLTNNFDLQISSNPAHLPATCRGGQGAQQGAQQGAGRSGLRGAQQAEMVGPRLRLCSPLPS